MSRNQNNQKYVRKVPWNQVDFEDKKAIVGGGRAGYEARKRNGYGDVRY